MVESKSIAIVSFNCLCTILAAYMAIKQMKNYLENDDESAISFEEISEASQDNFATYTICFMDERGMGLYKRDKWLYEEKKRVSRSKLLQQDGNQVSGYELEIEDNKLVLRNASELNGAGKLFVYDKQFFFNPVANLYRCDNGEMITTNITIEYETMLKYV